MNQPFLIFKFFIIGVALSACHRLPINSSDKTTATAVRYGLITCFNKDVKNPDGTPVYCETSAVAFDGSRLIFASDKPVPGDTLSPVFSTDFNDNASFSSGTMTYFTDSVFRNAVKYEDFATSPDGSYLFATTGFDRVKENTADFDSFNTLLFWKRGNEKEVKVIAPTTRNGVISSVGLRNKLSAALKSTQFPNGPPYYKIEGLACLPNNQLLFGVREVGESYEKFEYTVRFLQVSYQIKNDELILGNDFLQIYDFKPNSSLLQGKVVAVSGLEYDKFNNRLYLLTSYESSATIEGIGAFLWTLSMRALKNNEPPALVMDENKNPLVLGHKAEGITVLSKEMVFIVHDDDRLLGGEGTLKGNEPFFRMPNQAAYTILKIR